MLLPVQKRCLILCKWNSHFGNVYKGNKGKGFAQFEKFILKMKFFRASLILLAVILRNCSSNNVQFESKRVNLFPSTPKTSLLEIFKKKVFR